MRWPSLLSLVVMLSACGHDGSVVRVNRTMKVSDLRVALGGGDPACSVVWGKRLPTSGRPVRVEWRGHHLDGRLRCGAEARKRLPADPQVQQVGMIFWEPDEKLFSVGHPSGPGRVDVAGFPDGDALEVYWQDDNDPEVCSAVEATPAIEFLSALDKIVAGFARIAFPGLTVERAACPCSFEGSFATRPSEDPWRPLDWVEVATTRPWKKVGSRWVACGSAARVVRIAGPSGWTPIGDYYTSTSITALAGDDTILFQDKVWRRGHAEPVFEAFSQLVSGDGARIGAIECATKPSDQCTLLHLVERSPHGEITRDWKVPVPPRSYLSEGYSTDGFFLVRYEETHNHWVLARVERDGLFRLDRLPEDSNAWTAVLDRHRRSRDPLEEPKPQR